MKRMDCHLISPATLRNRIRYGWKFHSMSELNPAERVISQVVRNEREHPVDRHEVLLLCRATQHKETRAAARITFYSGMRMSEIIRAERVDGMFVLTDTKNGKLRHIPIRANPTIAARLPLPDQSTISRHFGDDQ